MSCHWCNFGAVSTFSSCDMLYILAYILSSSNSGLSYWSSLTSTLEFLDAAILIHNYESAAVPITTVDNMSSNTTWYCVEIEPVNRFRSNPTRVEHILINHILTYIKLLGYHLGIFTPGLCNVVSKTAPVNFTIWVNVKDWTYITS